jgi:hypothetical protein
VSEQVPARRAPYAMVPEEVITRCRDGLCVWIYAYLDLKCGSQGFAIRGYAYVGGKLGLQARTVREHAHHLADDGLIALDEPQGNEAATMRIAHNPSRGLVREGVALEPRPARSKAESGWKRYAAQGDGQTIPADLSGQTSRREAGAGGAPDAPPRPRAARTSGDAQDAGGRDAPDAPRPRSPRSEVGLEPTPRATGRPECESEAARPPSRAVALPPSYECEQALARIVAGLQRPGPNRAAVAAEVAEEAARLALRRAPYGDPTADGWAKVCEEAREFADELRREPTDARQWAARVAEQSPTVPDAPPEDLLPRGSAPPGLAEPASAASPPIGALRGSEGDRKAARR